MRTVFAGAIVWMCAIQFFVAQVVVQLSWTTPYSLAKNFISDLGNTACAPYSGNYVCSPMHAVMNASFSLQGVIIIVGTVLLLSAFRRSLTKNIVVVLLLLTGVGMFGVGVFPENENNRWHVYSAALQFITGNLALVISGLFRIPAFYNKLYLTLSVIMGLCGLIATALFANGYHFGLGVGGMERVAAYTFPLWLIYSGALAILRIGREA